MSGESDSKENKSTGESIYKEFPLEGLEEHVVVEGFIEPFFQALPENIIGILHYGCTEMLNNAVDHSEGTGVIIFAYNLQNTVTVGFQDNGIGIFEKIQRAFGLDTPHDAIIELCKGKLTTDPKHHTGEGIFFTCRACDSFLITSNGLIFGHRGGPDWLLEKENIQQKGTVVSLTIKKDTSRTMNEVFDKYSDQDDDEVFGFTKTHFPVILAQFGPDKLISRSIAKRVVNRFYKFKEVLLDFTGVDSIGPAFADEVFRVFAQSHPEVHIQVINANEQVTKMIRRAMNANGEQSPPQQEGGK